jgi:ATP dependent DNA ligase C terminal region
MQSRSLKDLHARCHRSTHPVQALPNVFSHRTFRDEAGITIAAREQEFVIGGYTPGPRNFDALIFGYYDGDKLTYVGRTRNGFTPAIREQLFKLFRALHISQCPFANLPEGRSGRWGLGLTAAK